MAGQAGQHCYRADRNTAYTIVVAESNIIILSTSPLINMNITLRIFLAPVLLATGFASALAADFPVLKQQIDSTTRSFGTNDCATQRTGIWLVDGGVVVEIKKPPKTCTFEYLNLVVDGQPIQSSAVDSAFYCRKNRETGANRCEWYRGEAGKIFFKTDLAVDPQKITGITEPNWPLVV